MGHHRHGGFRILLLFEGLKEGGLADLIGKSKKTEGGIDFV